MQSMSGCLTQTTPSGGGSHTLRLGWPSTHGAVVLLPRAPKTYNQIGDRLVVDTRRSTVVPQGYITTTVVLRHWHCVLGS